MGHSGCTYSIKTFFLRTVHFKCLENKKSLCPKHPLCYRPLLESLWRSEAVAEGTGRERRGKSQVPCRAVNPTPEDREAGLWAGCWRPSVVRLVLPQQGYGSLAGTFVHRSTDRQEPVTVTGSVSGQRGLWLENSTCLCGRGGPRVYTLMAAVRTAGVIRSPLSDFGTTTSCLQVRPPQGWLG